MGFETMEALSDFQPEQNTNLPFMSLKKNLLLLVSCSRQIVLSEVFIQLLRRLGVTAT